MDDLKTLREGWGTPDAPADTARAEARAALLARAGGAGRAPRRARRRLRIPIPLPRTGVRLVAIGALAVAIAAGVTVAQNLGGTDAQGRRKPFVPGIPAGPVANAAEALDRAAAAADARPFTAPRPDQWTYIENRNTSPAQGPGGVATGGPLKTRVERLWRRADGKQSAWMENGKVQVQTEPGPLTPPMDYPTLSTLPTEPEALLRWADDTMGGLGGDTDEGRWSMAFNLFNTILRNSVLPASVEAAIYRTMKTIPGVTLVTGGVDAGGRPALAVGRVQEGWLRIEVLLDRKTYRYLGERSVAIKSHTNKGLDRTMHVKRGTVQIYVVRVGAGIVDRPGQRPS
ncbi:CU044_5270 family protein [Actinomadura alba]|uniref:CU044_5270 family protein n=1 Tax=Actinomadura alba TaxID=406431 RepID=A0ABR7M236_9ACTN|nr:CU044_5270 family protein [Actinomadura alba]MBC6470785.1 CU044_5270 family protein [Actinomadura alba]